MGRHSRDEPSADGPEVEVRIEVHIPGAATSDGRRLDQGWIVAVDAAEFRAFGDPDLAVRRMVDSGRDNLVRDLPGMFDRAGVPA